MMKNNWMSTSFQMLNLTLDVRLFQLTIKPSREDQGDGGAACDTDVVDVIEPIFGYSQNAVPPPLESSDSIPQETALESIFEEQPGSFDQALEDYRNTRTSTVKLSTLRDHYNNDNLVAAINLLRGRRRLHIDSNLTMPYNHPQLKYSSDQHFLDYLLVVPTGPGLDAILPNLKHDAHYEFRLDLSRPHWRFRVDPAPLGFDPAGRMMYIGEYRQEAVFLAFPDRAEIGLATNPQAVRQSGQSTQMDPVRSRFVVSMFASLLDVMKFRDFEVHKKGYPKLSHPKHIRDHSSIMCVPLPSLLPLTALSP